MMRFRGKCCPYRVLWQQREGFLLWLDRPDPEREVLWTDAENRVPIFETYQQLSFFVLGLGGELETQATPFTNLDAAAAWLANRIEQPIAECLRVWNLFDDLAASVQEVFLGNERSPKRNRVFDLLYAANGPYLNSEIVVPWRMVGPLQWQPEEMDSLRRILTQGLALWQQNTYWLREI